MSANHDFILQRIEKNFSLALKEKNEKMYILLYRVLKQIITKEEIPNGMALPPSRVLSDLLQISRTTVLKTYEYLALEKLISSKQGSKTIVCYEFKDNEKKELFDVIDANKYPKISKKGQTFLENIALINRQQNNNLAFRPGLPPVDIFPINQWKKLSNNYWQHIKFSDLNYSETTGINILKKQIRDYLFISRKVSCKTEQIIIVSGSLQSLYLIANTLIDEGDSVVLENPLFPNVHSIFKSMKANLIPINIDDGGIKVEDFNQINVKNPKLIHVTPTNHYPLGVRMSLARKYALLEWASQNKTIIIENNFEYEIATQKEEVPSIFSLDTENRTIYLGTFNRLLHPSLRLAYMILPPYLVPSVNAILEHSHRFVPTSIQLVMSQFIEKNYLYQFIINCLKVARERHSYFLKVFKNEIDFMTIKNTDFSSFHVLATFNENVSQETELQFIEVLHKNGIVVFSLSKCYVLEPKVTGFIMGYSSVKESMIQIKIKIIKTLYESFSKKQS